MAGYSGFSKSNNAVAAEAEGKFPLTAAARKAGIPAELIRRFVHPCEWHHTSVRYNATNYYDVAEIVEFFETDPEAALALAQFPAVKMLRRIGRRIRHSDLMAFDEWLCDTLNSHQEPKRARDLRFIRDNMIWGQA